jgi:hypothetical protein
VIHIEQHDIPFGPVTILQLQPGHEQLQQGVPQLRQISILIVHTVWLPGSHFVHQINSKPILVHTILHLLQVIHVSLGTPQIVTYNINVL